MANQKPTGFWYTTRLPWVAGTFAPVTACAGFPLRRLVSSASLPSFLSAPVVSGVAFPSVAPLGLRSPPSRSVSSLTIGTTRHYDCPRPVSSASFLTRGSIPDVLTYFVSRKSCTFSGSLSRRSLRLNARSLGQPVHLYFRRFHQETVGSPKFPSCPCEHMPRSQTPVVSYTLAITCLGLLPSAACNASALGRDTLRLIP
jgi:hypothetical protein